MLGKTNSTAGGSSDRPVIQYNFRAKPVAMAYPVTAVTTDGIWGVDGFAVAPGEGNYLKYYDKDTSTEGYGTTAVSLPAVCRLRSVALFIRWQGTYQLQICGSDNVAAKDYENDAYWDVLYDSNGYTVELPGGISEINITADKDYRFYRVRCRTAGGSWPSEITYNVVEGGVVCALASANMTPKFNAYLNNYMELVTLPYFAGQTFVPSQVRQLKPFAEGGCLIDYVDNGQPVHLELFLLTPATGDEYAYALAPTAGFELPDGYVSADQVGSLNLPAHVVKVVQERDFIQPALTANGIVGGNRFAVAMDSHIDDVRLAYKAFDGNTVLADAGTDQAHTGSGQPHWFEFYNPNPLLVTAMTVYNGGDNVLPKDWQFQASADGVQWDVLTDGSNENSTAGCAWSFTIPAAARGWYKYHRFYVTSGSGSDSGYTGITEFVITAKERVENWQMPEA